MTLHTRILNEIDFVDKNEIMYLTIGIQVLIEKLQVNNLHVRLNIIL